MKKIIALLASIVFIGSTIACLASCSQDAEGYENTRPTGVLSCESILGNGTDSF